MPTGLLGDERLARLVAEGNERAFSTLFRRYHQPLYRYCHSMLRHESDAQDALQSTFTSALVALRRSQRDAPLRPWLFRIAHNESISLLRRRRPGDELSEDLASSRPTVEESAQERAELAQLVADMQMLPERQRGALVMRELSGLCHEDVAQVLGVSVGAAKQTVFEARRALQEFAEGRAMACEDIQRTVSDGDGRALRGRRVRAHLRECASCSAFAAAIPERRTALMALSPALPAMAASGLLTKITGAGSAHHGGGGGLLAGATGKSLGAAMTIKSLATGAAIVATAAAGVGAVEIATHPAVLGASNGLIRSSSATGPAGAASAGGRHGHGSTGAGSSAARTAGGQGGHSANWSATSAGAALHHLSATGHSRGGQTILALTPGSPGSAAAPRSNSGRGQGTGPSNPNAHGGNPNASGGNSGGGNGSTTGTTTTGSTTPGSTGTGSTNAHGGNPNAGGGNVNATGGNPNAGGGNPDAHGGNPNAGGSNPTTTGTNLNAHGGNLNAQGGNPNAKGGNLNAQGGNPNAKGGKSSTTSGATS